MASKEYQQLVSELNYYQDLLTQVEGSVENLKKTKQDLKDFKEEESKEVLAPIATGVYVEANLKNKDLFVNIGSGVVVKKSVDQAIEILDRQEKDVLLEQNKLIEKIEYCYKLLQEQQQDQLDNNSKKEQKE
jgi:prefoldin alpha subunit